MPITGRYPSSPRQPAHTMIYRQSIYHAQMPSPSTGSPIKGSDQDEKLPCTRPLFVFRISCFHPSSLRPPLVLGHSSLGIPPSLILHPSSFRRRLSARKMLSHDVKRFESDVQMNSKGSVACSLANVAANPFAQIRVNSRSSVPARSRAVFDAFTRVDSCNAVASPDPVRIKTNQAAFLTAANPVNREPRTMNPPQQQAIFAKRSHFVLLCNLVISRVIDHRKRSGNQAKRTQFGGSKCRGAHP